MKFYGGVQGAKKDKLLNCGGDLDYHADCLIRNPAITQQITNRFW